MPRVVASHGSPSNPPYRRLPYAAYGRVNGFLAELEPGALEGNPPVVAKAALDQLAPGTRDQVAASLAALGLMEASGLASTELIRIVRGDAATLRQVLRRRVGEVLAGAIEVIQAGEAPHEIDGWIKEQGYSGDTVRRVRSFLLAAMEDLDIPADLRPYRARLRRQGQNIAAEARSEYMAADESADWRETRSDQYVGVLIQHLKNRLKDAGDPETAQRYEWLLDRIERLLQSPPTRSE